MKEKLLTVMLDLSRNGVMKVDELKKYILLIKKMGYNAIGLYLEDVYEMEGEPYFGHLRGRYSKQELKEINIFAKENGITAIPFIQTLAHLDGIFKWKTYWEIRDIKDTLLIDEPKTYELIEKMFKTMRECFDTEQINIGMDEAGMVGLGNYLWRFGYKEDRGELLYSHLLKVLEIAKRYHFKPTMWSDMFLSLKAKGKDLKKYIPDGVTLCNWNYYSFEKETYDKGLKTHLEITDDIAFAGGAWTWSGFAPQNLRSIKSMKAAMESCRENKIDNVVITVWGDDGRDCSYYAVLPSLFYCAEKYLYNTTDGEIKKKFFTLFGVEFDTFMKLDLPNGIKNNYLGNPCRYGLYNDPLFGRADYHITEGDGAEYKKFAVQLKNAAKKVGEYAYLFETMSALCKVMELKYDLGVKTRKAYLSGDKEKLQNISQETYPKLIKRLKEFTNDYRDLWLRENKPFGYEIQAARLGGLQQRLKDAKQTIDEYLSEKIEKIDELEQPVLPLNSKLENSAELYEQRYLETISPANICYW